MVKPYAAAIFELGVERGKAEAFYNALKSVNEVLLKNSEYLVFLSCPNISIKERLASFDEAFSKTLPDEISQVLKLMCEDGYIKYFCEFFKFYEIMLEKHKKVTKAKIISAVELTRKEKISIKTKLEKSSGYSVEADFFVDETILGGIVVEINGKLIDGSLRKKLLDAKEVMLG